MPANLRGNSVCVTGLIGRFTRTDLEARLQLAGAIVHRNVRANTSYLVVGRSPGDTKLAAARRFGTPTLTEREALDALRDAGLAGVEALPTGPAPAPRRAQTAREAARAAAGGLIPVGEDVGSELRDCPCGGKLRYWCSVAVDRYRVTHLPTGGPAVDGGREAEGALTDLADAGTTLRACMEAFVLSEHERATADRRAAARPTATPAQRRAALVRAIDVRAVGDEADRLAEARSVTLGCSCGGTKGYEQNLLRDEWTVWHREPGGETRQVVYPDTILPDAAAIERSLAAVVVYSHRRLGGGARPEPAPPPPDPAVAILDAARSPRRGRR